MSILKDWYKNWRTHPARTIVDLDRYGKPRRNHGDIITSYKQAYPLTDLQMSGSVYEPIEAYRERWDHKEDKQGNFVSATPIPNTKERHDLPPLYVQWKQDWQRRFLNG